MNDAIRKDHQHVVCLFGWICRYHGRSLICSLKARGDDRCEEEHVGLVAATSMQRCRRAPSSKSKLVVPLTYGAIACASNGPFGAE